VKSRILTAFVLYGFFVLGLFLLVAPWTPLWERATLAISQSVAGGWIRSGWVRGLVSGLGALDLYVAAQVAVDLFNKLAGGRTGHESEDR